MNEKSMEFMLAEYNSIQEHVIKLEGIKSSRLNYYLIFISIIIASFCNIFEHLSKKHFILFLLSTVLFVVGFITLLENINYSQAVISLHRKARLRQAQSITITLHLFFLL